MDQFYIEKFMEIQQQNVVLSNKLRELFEDELLKEIIEKSKGSNFFKILEDTPA